MYHTSYLYWLFILVIKLYLYNISMYIINIYLILKKNINILILYTFINNQIYVNNKFILF